MARVKDHLINIQEEETLEAKLQGLINHCRHEKELAEDKIGRIDYHVAHYGNYAHWEWEARAYEDVIKKLQEILFTNDERIRNERLQDCLNVMRF